MVTLFYYARSVDPIIMIAFGSIASPQENPTYQTMQKVKQFLDYESTHPDAIIAYQRCSSPRWDNLPSGNQRSLSKGLNLGYMYWGQKHSSE